MAKINSIDNHRFINEVIGPQLQENRVAKISTSDGMIFDIDYRIIDNGDPRSFIDVIFLLTGFGSGWTGISKLAYDLAKLDYQVCMLSLPGYGNSTDPYLPTYMNKAKMNDVEVLDKFIKKVLSGRNIHLAGHSMGAEIATRFVHQYPQNVKTLMLLNPAGFEKRGMLEVATKFAINGIRHTLAFRGNHTWAELKGFLPKEKSAFGFDRWIQRVKEWHHLCNDEARWIIEVIADRIPVAYITGSKDSVFPQEDSSIFNGSNHAEKYVLPLWHNTTMFGSEQTAKAINNFICNISI